MRIFRYLKEKMLVRRFAALLVVAGLCCMALVSFFLIKEPSLAWFFENREASAGGLRLQTETEQLRFEPMITVVPTVADLVYEPIYYIRHDDGSYYRAEKATETEATGGELAGIFDGEEYLFSLDEEGNKMPIELTGLFPGETLMVTVRFRCIGSGTISYRLALSDFDDSEGRFTIPEGAGNTPGEYSVLGIFKAELAEITAENTTADFAVGANSGSYFASFDTVNGTSILTADPFSLVTGNASAADGVISCTFRISVQLGDIDAGTQYYALHGTVTNQLSKKRFSIGALRLSENPADGEAGS